MRKFSIYFTPLFFIFCSAAFVNNNVHEDKAAAVVSSYEGLLIFTDCKPFHSFDSLGVVELGFISGTQYNTIKSNLVRKAKKKFPNAEGLILDLKNNGLDRGYAIKFTN